MHAFECSTMKQNTRLGLVLLFAVTAAAAQSIAPSSAPTAAPLSDAACVRDDVLATVIRGCDVLVDMLRPTSRLASAAAPPPQDAQRVMAFAGPELEATCCAVVGQAAQLRCVTWRVQGLHPPNVRQQILAASICLFSGKLFCTLIVAFHGQLPSCTTS